MTPRGWIPLRLVAEYRVEAVAVTRELAVELGATVRAIDGREWIDRDIAVKLLPRKVDLLER